MPRIISTNVNIKEKHVNIDNVNSRYINSNNVNCIDKIYRDKGLTNCTNITRTEQEGSYRHLERYYHVCRVAERGVGKFNMCSNCQCDYYSNKSCQLKEWKLWCYKPVESRQESKCLQNRQLQHNSFFIGTRSSCQVIWLKDLGCMQTEWCSYIGFVRQWCPSVHCITWSSWRVTYKATKF